MRGVLIVVAAVVWLLVGYCPSVFAADAAPLRVGIYEKPPFVIAGKGGEWDGLAVDLWSRIAARAKLGYTFVPVEQGAAFAQLERGEIDVLLGQTSVSAQRERLVDFSHAFLVEPLAAAIQQHILFPHWIEFLRVMPSHGVYSVLVAGAVGLIVFAVLFWIVERRLEQSHFRGNPLQAIGSALWFSAVTMTTVGYGDKTPLTTAGRALAFVWMFIGILMISAFTATVASTVTASRGAASIFHISDVSRFETAVLTGSAAIVQLRNAGVPSEQFDHVDEALTAVVDGRAGAFVADYVTIRYELNQPKWRGLRAAVLQDSSSRMAIPVRQGLPELDAINVALLETLDDPGWQGVLRRWVGAPLPLGI